MNASRPRTGGRFGPYELRSMLGRGAMGEVYEAYDTHNDRVVALKLLPEELAQDPAYRKRFRRESHAATRIADPHIVPINRAGEIDGMLYLDMRLIRGDNLRALLRRQGRMEPDRAVHIIVQIAAALDAAHDAGLVHRDVKPANILVTPTDFAFLTDFGIARSEGDSATTMVGITAGSYTYMAPERFDSGPVTGRSDTYSLACVLHECLTGTTPFPVQNVSSLIRAHLSEAPPRPSLQRGEIPEALDAVLAHAMSKSPEDRFSTTGEFADAARAAVGLPSAEEVAAAPPPPAPNPVESPRPQDTGTVQAGPLPPLPQRIAPGPGAPRPVQEPTTFQPFGPQGPTIAAQFQPRGDESYPPESEVREEVPPAAEPATTAVPADTGASAAAEETTRAMARGPVPTSPDQQIPDEPAPAPRGYETTGSLRIIAPPDPQERDTGSDLPVITPEDPSRMPHEDFRFAPTSSPEPKLPQRAPDSDPQTPKLPQRGSAQQTPGLPPRDPAQQTPGLAQRESRQQPPEPAEGTAEPTPGLPPREPTQQAAGLPTRESGRPTPPLPRRDSAHQTPGLPPRDPANRTPEHDPQDVSQHTPDLSQRESAQQAPGLPQRGTAEPTPGLPPRDPAQQAPGHDQRESAYRTPPLPQRESAQQTPGLPRREPNRPEFVQRATESGEHPLVPPHGAPESTPTLNLPPQAPASGEQKLVLPQRAPESTQSPQRAPESTPTLHLPPQAPKVPLRAPESDSTSHTELLPHDATAAAAGGVIGAGFAEYEDGYGRDGEYRTGEGYADDDYGDYDPNATRIHGYAEYDENGYDRGEYDHDAYPDDAYADDTYPDDAYDEYDENDYTSGEYEHNGYDGDEYDDHAPHSLFGYAPDDNGEYAEDYEYAGAASGYDEGARTAKKRSVAVPLVLGFLGAAVAIGVGVVGWQVLGKSPTNSSADGQQGAAAVATTAPAAAPAPQTTAETTTTEATSTPPSGSTSCSSSSSGEDTEYTRSASGNSMTSCGFAEAVRKAYAKAAGSGSDSPSSVEAVSPATGRSYTMSCKATGRLVTCTGGDNAIVYVY